ncbi:MAG: FAD-dependent monooxygenase [Thermoanaerobaculia bacterium]|nr:FAD-dependent monooxygenase [Thermoanaerobaculia bacterium]
MDIAGMRIVVAGAGIGGASSALLFARAGASVTLLERVAEPRAVGAGIAIAENGSAVLTSLGLGAALDATAVEVPAARITDAEGRELLAPPPGVRVRLLRRSTLQSLLLDALAAVPRVTARFGTVVHTASSDGRVTTRNGEREETLTADLVIGADGVHSRVRECGHFGARISPPGIPYVRTLLPEGRATGVEAWTRAGLFGAFAVDGGTYAYASAGSHAAAAAIAGRDVRAFRRAWSSAYPPAEKVLSGLDRFEDLLVNHVLRVRCSRFSDGNLVLIGDAAHAMPPNLGQGGNSALVDAAVLFDEIRRAPELPAALAAYENRRRPRVEWVARTSARLGVLAELTHPVLRVSRDRILLPLVRRFTRPPDDTAVLQESPSTLLAIGHAIGHA